MQTSILCNYYNAIAEQKAMFISTNYKTQSYGWTNSRLKTKAQKINSYTLGEFPLVRLFQHKLCFERVVCTGLGWWQYIFGGCLLSFVILKVNEWLHVQSAYPQFAYRIYCRRPLFFISMVAAKKQDSWIIDGILSARKQTRFSLMDINLKFKYLGIMIYQNCGC